MMTKNREIEAKISTVWLTLFFFIQPFTHSSQKILFGRHETLCFQYLSIRTGEKKTVTEPTEFTVQISILLLFHPISGKKERKLTQERNTNRK